MNDVFAKIKDLGSSLTIYTTLGSFLLYVLGYLIIRFHLTTLGLSSDLAVLDERYLFTGGRFVIYMVSAIPTIIFILIVFGGLVWLPFWSLPNAAKNSVQRGLDRLRQRMTAWWLVPDRLAIAAISFSVVTIQLVMRQCFFLAIYWWRTIFPLCPVGCVFCLLKNTAAFSRFISRHLWHLLGFHSVYTVSV